MGSWPSLPSMARNPGPSPAERSLTETGLMVLCSPRISPRSPAGTGGAGLRFFVVAVADVVAGGVVVAAVDLLAGAVEVDGDGRPVSGVGDAVDATVVGQDRRGPVFLRPRQLPALLQAGVLVHGAVVEALVALLEDGADHGTEGAPGSVVVDPGPRARGPDEDLHRERAVRGVDAAGHVPFLCLPRLIQDLRYQGVQEGRLFHQAVQQGDRLPQIGCPGEVRVDPVFVCFLCRFHLPLLCFFGLPLPLEERGADR